MPKVLYVQELQRSVKVEVTEEQLAALREHNSTARDEAQSYVVDTALGTIENEPLKFVNGTGWTVVGEDEPDEELFDIG